MKPLSFFAAFGLLLLPSGEAGAQDQTSEQASTEPSRYFRKPLDLWKAGLAYGPSPRPPAEPDPIPPRVALRESIWAQPIQTPDGTWTIYVPPRQVLDFLESPTEETAKAYLSWKETQARKLKKAMELLAQVKEPPAASAAPEAKVPAASAPPALLSHEKLTYFKRPSCPHCVTQDAVLAEWLKGRPGATLDVVLPGERPLLWQTYGVRGTPTLIVELGSPDRKEVLVGLQSAEALDAALGRLAQIKGDAAGTPQKEIIR